MSRWIPSTIAAALLISLSASSLSAQDEGEGPVRPPRPDFRCLQACSAEASAALRACREDGGDFRDCFAAHQEALQACLAAAECERPEPPPPPCGAECFAEARQAVVDCIEAGGDRRECVGAYREILRTCRAEAGCPVPEPRPRPCGFECIGVARESIASCRESGGSLRDCAMGFLEAFAACRDEAGCGQPEEEDEAEEVVAALVAAVVTFERGDVDRSGATNMTDAVVVLQHLFLGADEPSCLDAADANDDGEVNVADASMILGALFLGTGPLPAPTGTPGVDPTEDRLDCTAI